KISQTYANAPDLAWRNGKLILDNLTLADALPMINRYLSTPLSLADTATGQLRIGGVFNTKEIPNLVASLPKVLPVYVRVDQNGQPVINALPRG
ncbi:MAG: peptide ABC transporter substrate-binding protein, partial [Pseudomonas helleri]